MHISLSDNGQLIVQVLDAMQNSMMMTMPQFFFNIHVSTIFDEIFYINVLVIYSGVLAPGAKFFGDGLGILFI